MKATSSIFKNLVLRSRKTPGLGLLLSSLLVQSLAAGWPSSSDVKTDDGVPEHRRRLSTDVQAVVHSAIPPRLYLGLQPEHKHSGSFNDDFGPLFDCPSQNDVSASIAEDKTWEWKEGRLFTYELILTEILSDHTEFLSKLNLKANLSPLGLPPRSSNPSSGHFEQTKSPLTGFLSLPRSPSPIHKRRPSLVPPGSHSRLAGCLDGSSATLPQEQNPKSERCIFHKNRQQSSSKLGEFRLSNQSIILGLSNGTGFASPFETLHPKHESNFFFGQASLDASETHLRLSPLNPPSPPDPKLFTDTNELFECPDCTLEYLSLIHI